jgi:flagellar hook protein FlgE
MIRSMYAAVTGLRSHQTMMDVVGNNIANVNTHGFKKSQALFREVLSQTVVGARAPGEEIGGTNPAQIGLGTSVGAISQNMEQGALQRTGRTLDIAIEGDGFFVTEFAGERLYTRAGSFYVDAEGRLVNTDGALIQGWQADATGSVDTSLNPTEVRIPIGRNIEPAATTQVQLGGNLPADALVGDDVVLNVTVYDQQGLPIDVQLTLTKTAANEWTATGAYGDPLTAFAVTDNVMTFDATGELVAPADFNLNIAAGVLPNAAAIELTVGGADVSTRITEYGGLASTAVILQNGSATGSLQSLSVGADGVITGSYSNGQLKPIGQIALANFANPEGMERVTGSNWRETANSGLAQVGVAGTGGRGAMASTTLEMSNVDLAEEFTALIRAQRGFQANSRMVTASDEMLQEVVNMKR